MEREKILQALRLRADTAKERLTTATVNLTRLCANLRAGCPIPMELSASIT